jgi:SH3-like domain-containing protein
MVRTTCIILIACAALPVWAAPKEMSVQVEETQIRKAPNFFSGQSGRLAYGDRVDVVDTQKDWIEISGPQGSGWVHSSALTKKRIKLKAGSEDVGEAASDEELALAGKGFSKEVEAEYKARNPDADFSAINRIEEVRFSPEESLKFLKAGGLEVSR